MSFHFLDSSQLLEKNPESTIQFKIEFSDLRSLHLKPYTMSWAVLLLFHSLELIGHLFSYWQLRGHVELPLIIIKGTHPE